MKKRYSTKINIDPEWKAKFSQEQISLFDLSEECVDNWVDDANEIDKSIDDKLKRNSEEKYLEIVTNIVSVSRSQLEKQNRSKQNNRILLLRFFVWFLIAQYVIMIALFVVEGFGLWGFFLKEAIILTYISSVFVETLGAIIIMVKYAFQSDQEVQILKILNGVVEKFQKFSK